MSLRRSVSVLLVAGVLAVASAAQAVNTPQASLKVNYNTGTSFPLTAYMGRLDLNSIVVEGLPNATYALIYGTPAPGTAIPGLGTLHIQTNQPFGLVYGVLDINGHDEVALNPGALAGFPDGTIVGLQALVADASQLYGWNLSGATTVTVVETMSSGIEQLAPTGSQAQILGPVTGFGPNSILVAGVPFRLMASTQFGNSYSSIADVTLGDWVQINGEYGALPGVIDATEINDEDAEPEVRLRGRVQGTGISGYNVFGFSLYVNSNTVYNNPIGPNAYSEITLGQLMEAYVPIAEMAFPHATSIDMNIPDPLEPEPEDPPEVEVVVPPIVWFCD
ncbi:MAG: DUF5666 domain-containing protein [Planctomycetota bacterium]